MAQLDIERKQGNSMWWLWLLIAILVILALWWFFWGSSGRGMGEMAADSTTTVGQMADTTGSAAAAAPMPGASGAVGTFADFVADSRSGVMGLDHVNTATGLRDLAAAAEALAAPAGNAAVGPRADSLRSYADELQQNQESLRHADIVHRAFVVGAGMLRDIKTAGSSTSAADVDAVQQAADGVKPDTPLLDQRDAVQRYWDSAASAIQAMRPAQP